MGYSIARVQVQYRYRICIVYGVVQIQFRYSIGIVKVQCKYSISLVYVWCSLCIIQVQYRFCMRIIQAYHSCSMGDYRCSVGIVYVQCMVYQYTYVGVVQLQYGYLLGFRLETHCGISHFYHFITLPQHTVESSIAYCTVRCVLE